jgi:hypothetical protein
MDELDRAGGPSSGGLPENDRRAAAFNRAGALVQDALNKPFFFETDSLTRALVMTHIARNSEDIRADSASRGTSALNGVMAGNDQISGRSISDINIAWRDLKLAKAEYKAVNPDALSDIECLETVVNGGFPLNKSQLSANRGEHHVNTRIAQAGEPQDSSPQAPALGSGRHLTASLETLHERVAGMMPGNALAGRLGFAPELAVPQSAESQRTVEWARRKIVRVITDNAAAIVSGAGLQHAVASVNELRQTAAHAMGNAEMTPTTPQSVARAAALAIACSESFSAYVTQNRNPAMPDIARGQMRDGLRSAIGGVIAKLNAHTSHDAEGLAARTSIANIAGAIGKGKLRWSSSDTGQGREIVLTQAITADSSQMPISCIQTSITAGEAKAVLSAYRKERNSALADRSADDRASVSSRSSAAGGPARLDDVPEPVHAAPPQAALFGGWDVRRGERSVPQSAANNPALVQAQIKQIGAGHDRAFWDHVIYDPPSMRAHAEHAGGTNAKRPRDNGESAGSAPKSARTGAPDPSRNGGGAESPTPPRNMDARPRARNSR